MLHKSWLEPNKIKSTSRQIRGEAGEGTGTGSTETVARLAIMAIEELSIVAGDGTTGSLKAVRNTDKIQSGNDIQVPYVTNTVSPQTRDLVKLQDKENGPRPFLVLVITFAAHICADKPKGHLFF